MPCLFCAIAERQVEASFVYEDGNVLAFMDIHPVNAGHILVIPRHHFASLSDLPEAIGAHLFIVSQRLAEAIRRSSVRCEAILLTLADGPAAGQEVPHVHLHVIPRFTGDSYRISAESSTPARAELDAVALEIARLGQFGLPLVSVPDRTAATLSAWRMPVLSGGVRGSVVQYRHE